MAAGLPCPTLISEALPSPRHPHSLIKPVVSGGLCEPHRVLSQAAPALEQRKEGVSLQMY